MGYTRDSIYNGYKYHARAVAGLGLIEAVLEEFGLLENEVYLNFTEDEYDAKTGSFLGPRIKVTPKNLSGVSITMQGELPSLEISQTATLAEIGRKLLPLVGNFDKSFDEQRNIIQLTGRYKGVRLVIEDTPPATCTVRKVEEEVAVPEKVIPAHTEKKVRWVMEGDCNPLTAPVAVMEPPATVIPGSDDDPWSGVRKAEENNPPAGEISLDRESASDV